MNLLEYIASVKNKSGAIPTAPLSLRGLKGSLESISTSADVPGMSVLMSTENLARGLSQLIQQMGSVGAVGGDLTSVLSKASSLAGSSSGVTADQLAAALSAGASSSSDLASAVGGAVGLGAALGGYSGSTEVVSPSSDVISLGPNEPAPVSFLELVDVPTTLDGYGITDAVRYRESIGDGLPHGVSMAWTGSALSVEVDDVDFGTTWPISVSGDAATLGGRPPSYYTDVVSRLGYVPLQQGGGAGQDSNKIFIGWGTESQLRLQVDVTDFGHVWPISVSGDAATLGGQPPSYYTNVTSQLGYTPVNRAGDTLTGTLNVSTAGRGWSVGEIGTTGYVTTVAGSNTSPGYIEFYTPDGTRRGYVGFSSANNLMLGNDGAWGWTTTGSFTLGGTLTLDSGWGTNAFEVGTGDGATYSTHNVKVRGWNGWAFSTYDESVHGVYDFRLGKWTTDGGYYLNDGTAAVASGGHVWVSGGSCQLAFGNRTSSDNWVWYSLNGVLRGYWDAQGGNGTAGDRLQLDYNTGQLWTSGYGWLHSYFLPVSGGTMTGQITTSGDIVLQSGTTDTNQIWWKDTVNNTYVYSDVYAEQWRLVTSYRGGGAQVAVWFDVYSSILYLNNSIRVPGEIQATGMNSYRQVAGNYGTFWRQDGSNLYLMLTNSGDQYGGYNSLRPFHVDLASGNVTLEGSTTTVTNLNATSGMTFQGSPVVRGDGYYIFHWSGQSGQPTWLWGGGDGTNMYVYNPSNFNVNGAVYWNGMHLNWVSQGVNPAYLIGTVNNDGEMSAISPGVLSVNYANSARYLTYLDSNGIGAIVINSTSASSGQTGSWRNLGSVTDTNGQHFFWQRYA